MKKNGKKLLSLLIALVIMFTGVYVLLPKVKADILPTKQLKLGLTTAATDVTFTADRYGFTTTGRSGGRYLGEWNNAGPTDGTTADSTVTAATINAEGYKYVYIDVLKTAGAYGIYLENSNREAPSTDPTYPAAVRNNFGNNDEACPTARATIGLYRIALNEDGMSGNTTEKNAKNALRIRLNLDESMNTTDAPSPAHDFTIGGVWLSNDPNFTSKTQDRRIPLSINASTPVNGATEIDNSGYSFTSNQNGGGLFIGSNQDLKTKAIGIGGYDYMYIDITEGSCHRIEFARARNDWGNRLNLFNYYSPGPGIIRIDLSEIKYKTGWANLVLNFIMDASVRPFTVEGITLSNNPSLGEVSTIEWDTEPVKKDYTVGETIDPTGGSFNVTFPEITSAKPDFSYSTPETRIPNDSKQAVTSAEVALNADMCTVNGGMSTAGEKTVTVSYGGKTLTYDIEVTKPVASISIKDKSTLEAVQHPRGGAFSVNGQITVTYENSDTEDFAITSEMCSVGGKALSDPDNANVMGTTGTKTITVTYAGKTDTYSLTVRAEIATAITAVTAPGTLIYHVGDTTWQNLNAGSVTVSYDNGQSQTINMDDSRVSLPLLNTLTTAEGSKQVMVTVTDGATISKTSAFAITVSKVVQSITITTQPTLSFPDGIALSAFTNSLAVGRITVNYNDNSSSSPMAMNAVGVTVTKASGGTALTAADLTLAFPGNTQKTITLRVSYDGKYVDYNITVTPKTITAITAITNPTKTSYFTDEITSASDISLTGGSVTVTFDNNLTEVITLPDSRVTADYGSQTMTTAGTKSITLSASMNSQATSVTRNFDITIVAIKLTSITVTPDTSLGYIENMALTVGNSKVNAVYNDTSKNQQIPLTVTMCNPQTTGTPGQKTITVTYTDTYGSATATYQITVASKAVSSIELENSPDKLDYIQGQELNLTGGEIKINYNNGSSDVVEITANMLSGYDKNKTGQQTVTVTLGTATATFAVNVVAKTLESIAVSANPAKTSYNLNDTFSAAGGKIKLNYDNGIPEEISMTADGVSLSSPDMSTGGEKEITATYSGKTAVFKINVIGLNKTVLESVNNDVKLEAPANTVPENTVIKAEKLESGEQFKAAETAMKDLAGKLTVFDIKLVSNSQNIQSSGKVQISIPLPLGYNKSNVGIFHIDTNGLAKKLDSKVDGEFIVFETDSFNSIVVAELSAGSVNDPVEDNVSTGYAVNISLTVFIMLLLCAVAFIAKKSRLQA